MQLLVQRGALIRCTRASRAWQRPHLQRWRRSGGTCGATARQTALLQTINPSPPPVLAPSDAPWRSPLVPALCFLLAVFMFWRKEPAPEDDRPRAAELSPPPSDDEDSARMLQEASVSDDLGRVVLVARRLSPPGPLRDLQDRQLKQLIMDPRSNTAVSNGSNSNGSSNGTQSVNGSGSDGGPPNGGPAPLGGLLLRYRSSVLLVLEGGIHDLMAVLRYMGWHGSDHHGLDSPRVVSFVLDAQTRLFPMLHTADVRGRDTGMPTVLLEAQWAGAVRNVDTFVKSSGARLSGLTPQSATQALRDPAFFLGDTLPTPATVLSLASATLGPGLDVFLDAFDLDWPVYKRALEELQAIPGAQPSDLDARVPGWHVLRRSYAWLLDKEAALQEKARVDAAAHAVSPLAHLYPKHSSLPSSSPLNGSSINGINGSTVASTAAAGTAAVASPAPSTLA